MQVHRNAAVAIAIVIAATGCASITRGETENFEVISSPSGATVTFESGLSCTTPCQMQLRRKHPFKVTVEKTGYKPIVASIDSRIGRAGRAGLLGNAILMGPGGFVVDMTSGALKDLLPNPLSIKLAPLDSPQPSSIDTPAETSEGVSQSRR